MRQLSAQITTTWNPFGPSGNCTHSHTGAQAHTGSKYGVCVCVENMQLRMHFVTKREWATWKRNTKHSKEPEGINDASNFSCSLPLTNTSNISERNIETLQIRVRHFIHLFVCERRLHACRDYFVFPFKQFHTPASQHKPSRKLKGKRTDGGERWWWDHRPTH